MTGTPILAGTNAFPLGSLGRMVSGAPGAAQLSNALDSAGMIAQQSTITAGGASNSSTYSCRVVSAGLGVDETVSFLTDATATAAELTAGIFAAIQANAALSVGFKVTNPTTTTILFVGTPGASYAFTVTFPANPGAQLTVATGTAAADASTYRLGRVLEIAGVSAGVQLAQSTCRPIAAGNFPSERADFTCTFDAAGSYTTDIQVRNLQSGFVTTVSLVTAAAANLGATLTAIKADVDSKIGMGLPNGTSSAISSPDVQVTFPPGWVVLDPATGASATGGAAAYTFAVGSWGLIAAADLKLVRDPRDRAPVRGVVDTSTTIEAGRAVPYVEAGNGTLWSGALIAGETVTAGGAVFVETAAGDDLAALRATQTATSIEAQGWKFRTADPNDAGSAIVYIP